MTSSFDITDSNMNYTLEKPKQAEQASHKLVQNPKIKSMKRSASCSNYLNWADVRTQIVMKQLKDYPIHQIQEQQEKK